MFAAAVFGWYGEWAQGARREGAIIRACNPGRIKLEAVLRSHDRGGNHAPLPEVDARSWDMLGSL
jgi:hypothetical protein